MRLIVGSSLARATKNWKVALKDLARCGAIERKETLFCHLPDVMPPHWFKMDAEHQRARERLEEIIARVEASPELSLPPTRRDAAASFTCAIAEFSPIGMVASSCSESSPSAR
jgi:hypothetical protein